MLDIIVLTNGMCTRCRQLFFMLNDKNIKCRLEHVNESDHFKLVRKKGYRSLPIVRIGDELIPYTNFDRMINTIKRKINVDSPNY